MPIKNNLFSFLGSSDITCPVCGKNKITTRNEKVSFPYGTGTETVELSTIVPVRRCEECNFEFTGDDADSARHEAICKHLGVLTPAEITQVRERYNISRAEFARITRVGEASINRWENGQLIQGGAMDHYLYLLTFTENFERIRSRKNASERVTMSSEKLTWRARLSERFVALKEDEKLLEQAAAFAL
jgi:putative zinc finger/helix-turn-helix YgiT family protein